MTIDVLIITRNRSAILHRCLKSLTEQTTKPNRVIVVDNNSKDNTKSVILSFKQRLPIGYFLEKRIGIPFARNLCIQNGRSKILAFIDDDCVADHNWISNILRFFSVHQKAVGLVGKINNLHPTNPFSAVEDLYHHRWIKTHINNNKVICPLSSGKIVDFKNAAFRVNFIKQFKFSCHTPFGDVGNEDVELGERIFRKNPNIFRVPAVVIKHQYSVTLARLLTRNFWSGYADEMLARNNQIDLEKSPYELPVNVLFMCARHSLNKLRGLTIKLLFVLLVLAFPLFSKAGRYYRRLAFLLADAPKLPIR